MPLKLQASSYSWKTATAPENEQDIDRAEMTKKNKIGRKKRDEYIYARTRENIDGFSFSVNKDGNIVFSDEIVSVYSEKSYGRPKGPKSITRIFHSGRKGSFDIDDTLRNDYDLRVAVDTNTKTIDNQPVSITVPVIFKPNPRVSGNNITYDWIFDVPFILDVIGMRNAPENTGWIFTINEMLRRGIMHSRSKVCMVVDSDLGNLHDYNKRKKPLVGDVFLPPNVTLIYASADTGADYLPNYVLQVADKLSSDFMNEIISGKIPRLHQAQDNPFFEFGLIHETETISERKD